MAARKIKPYQPTNKLHRLSSSRTVTPCRCRLACKEAWSTSQRQTVVRATCAFATMAYDCSGKHRTANFRNVRTTHKSAGSNSSSKCSMKCLRRNGKLNKFFLLIDPIAGSVFLYLSKILYVFVCLRSHELTKQKKTATLNCRHRAPGNPWPY